MARWIDGDPKVRARMIAQENRNKENRIRKNVEVIKANIVELSNKINEMQNQIGTGTPVQDKILNRRIASNREEMERQQAALRSIGIDFNPS